MTLPTLDQMTEYFNSKYRGNSVYKEQAIEIYGEFLNAVDLINTNGSKAEGLRQLRVLGNDTDTLWKKYTGDAAMIHLRKTIQTFVSSTENNAIYRAENHLGLTL